MLADDIPEDAYDLASIKAWFFGVWMEFGFELCDTYGVTDLREKQKVFKRFIANMEKFRP